MRVQFRNPMPETTPAAESVYISPSQLFLSAAKAYEAHAVSVYDGVVFVQIVDDKETPVFLPRSLFDVSDSGIPEDWICNTFADGAIQLVMGPEFVAKNPDAYNSMIDQEADQVERFWARVNSRSRNNDRPR